MQRRDLGRRLAWALPLLLAAPVGCDKASAAPTSPEDSEPATAAPEPTPTVPTEAGANANASQTLGPIGPVQPAADGPAFVPASATAANQPTCYRYRAAPLYQGLGWSHVVEVTNDCDRPLRCAVSTDVDPDPRHVAVLRPGQTLGFRTRVGSPSREYRPIVECIWEG